MLTKLAWNEGNRVVSDVSLTYKGAEAGVLIQRATGRAHLCLGEGSRREGDAIRPQQGGKR